MLSLDKDLFYLAGAIVGDGHIRNGVKHIGKDNSIDYGVNIHAKNKCYLEIILNIIKNKIDTKTEIKFQKRTYYISVRNKLLHTTLNKKFEIPAGKKSDRIFIPNWIKNDSNLKYFLAGYFDTDGGLRRGSIGFCSASKQMITDTKKCLEQMKIQSSLDRWINKKYDKEYYGLRIIKKDVIKFYKTIPLKNQDKIGRIMQVCRSGQTG